ncbi:PfkB family carbohydrate kinase [Massilia sp. YIM B02763]|uniref:carbohydrate kinase family protein n=1 Tax=Massilia sp. YIM B02763 TaxID=3050130 RepID=UPI0025B72942|nr:PfkB family carbohydrate kinase [Massilia sp. YIM B02763]MDN4054155.1 PfkB family carbohydrate kinase [Massilia sp. YIM B02763]
MTTIVFGEALVEELPAEQSIGGAPFNVARHLAAFMLPPLLITRIGNDRNGLAVRAEFERFVMPETGVQVDAMEETGRMLVERTGSGQRLTLLPGQAYDFIDPQAARDSIAAAGAQGARSVYFGTLAQRAECSRLALDAVLEATPARRFLDLNLRPGQAGEQLVTHALTAADVVKVNEAELQALFQWYFQIGPDDPPLATEEVHAACRALMDRFMLETLVVTLGHRGSVTFCADGSLLAHRDNPAPPFVIDTAGAGDAFAAIMLLGRERDWPLETTLARANEFAGAICAVAGAVPRDLGFYDKWVKRWR